MTEQTLLSLIDAGVESIKPMAETGCKLIEDLLGKPCKIAGDMLSDQIYSWQWSNRIRIACRAKEIMAENKIAEKVLPHGFLLPLLEASGNVEEPILQEMWAKLLASAVSNAKHQHPSYIRVLSEVSPLDVKLLQDIYNEYKNNSDSSKKPYYLKNACSSLGIEYSDAIKSGYYLVRLGITETRVKWDTHGGLLRSGADESAILSLYGLNFVEACG